MANNYGKFRHNSRYGRCTTLNDCYPERKIFRIPAEDTWVMGLLNTCSINTRKGRQVGTETGSDLNSQSLKLLFNSLLCHTEPIFPYAA